VRAILNAIRSRLEVVERPVMRVADRHSPVLPTQSPRKHASSCGFTDEQVRRTQFVLDAATREATTVLLDQRYFQLDTAAFAKFNAALEVSPAAEPAYAGASL
jgi:Protein of unknown function (DUF1778)